MGLVEPRTHDALCGFSYPCVMFLPQLQLMDKISIYSACVTTTPLTAGTAHYTRGIVYEGMHMHTITYTHTCIKECMFTSVGMQCFGS